MARPILADFDFNNQAKIINLPVATAAGQPVTYEQLNSAVENISWKQSARVASTATINLAAPGTTIDGITMANNDRFLAKDQTTASQNGIYIYNGTATPATRVLDASTAEELEAAVVTIQEGTSAGASFRQTAVNFTIDSGSVTWVSFGTTAPSATETTAGVAELATQAEVNTGTDTTRIVSPATLANWTGRLRKFTATIGDGSATSFNVDHNLNTRQLSVTVARTSGNYETVIVDETRPTANRVTLIFASAPSSASFEVTIIG